MIIGKINADDKLTVEEKRKDLLIEKRGKPYTLNDLFVVRTTNYLPDDMIIKPISQVPFFTKSNGLIRRAVLEYIKEKYHPDFYDEKIYRKIDEYIKNNYLPFTTQYRSTVHFTINGRVTSHGKGNFDSKNFVLIDPLKFHLENNSLVGLRVEDTYMKGKVKLSNDLVILVDENKYNELLNKYPSLEQYNVILYNGDQTSAVESYLVNMNIIPEKISEHGSDEHRCSKEFEKIISDISKLYNIPREKHYYSSSYKEDDKKNLLLWEYYRKDFFSLFLSKFKLSLEEYDRFLDLFCNLEDSDETLNLLINMLNKFGYEEFKNLVTEFNNNYINKVNNGSYECNDELLECLDVKHIKKY